MITVHIIVLAFCVVSLIAILVDGIRAEHRECKRIEAEEAEWRARSEWPIRRPARRDWLGNLVR